QQGGQFERALNGHIVYLCRENFCQIVVMYRVHVSLHILLRPLSQHKLSLLPKFPPQPLQSLFLLPPGGGRAASFRAAMRRRRRAKNGMGGGEGTGQRVHPNPPPSRGRELIHCFDEPSSYM